MDIFITKSYLRSDLPRFTPGDTIKVYQKVKEGGKERMSMFEGLVIAKKHGRGISGTFTVRKVVDGIGVEKIFPLHMPSITKIDVLRQTKVRRAKLYYIREKAAKEVRRKMKSYQAQEQPEKLIESEYAAVLESADRLA